MYNLHNFFFVVNTFDAVQNKKIYFALARDIIHKKENNLELYG